MQQMMSDAPSYDYDANSKDVDIELTESNEKEIIDYINNLNLK